MFACEESDGPCKCSNMGIRRLCAMVDDGRELVAGIFTRQNMPNAVLEPCAFLGMAPPCFGITRSTDHVDLNICRYKVVEASMLAVSAFRRAGVE